MTKPARDPINASIGASLRRRRLAAKLSLEDLGRQVGVTYQQIQKYETGANRIALSTAVALAKALACRVSDLLEGVEQDADRTAPLPPSLSALRACGQFDAIPLRVSGKLADLIDAIVACTGRTPRAPIASGEPNALAN